MRLHLEEFTDEKAWELFILQRSPSSLFQSWLWGEVQKKSGSTVVRYGIFDGKGLIGVAQVTHIRARRGPFLHVRHGPVLVRPTPAVWKETLALLAAEAKKLGCWFVRISPQIPDSEETRSLYASLGLLPAAIHRMDGEYCWVLDLDKTEDELIGVMRKTTRYEIRKAVKDHLDVFSTTDPKYLQEFFDLYARTSKRHSFVPHTGIREEFEIFAKRNQATLYLGKFQGETIASAIILYYGNQAIYHHGASLPSKAPVSTIVQWEAIREAKLRGMNLYNFWGIAPIGSQDHPWRGITLFKTGFGGRLVEYAHAHDLVVSPLYLIPRTIEAMRRMRRGYD